MSTLFSSILLYKISFLIKRLTKEGNELYLNTIQYTYNLYYVCFFHGSVQKWSLNCTHGSLWWRIY